MAFCVWPESIRHPICYKNERSKSYCKFKLKAFLSPDPFAKCQNGLSGLFVYNSDVKTEILPIQFVNISYTSYRTKRGKLLKINAKRMSEKSIKKGPFLHRLSKSTGK